MITNIYFREEDAYLLGKINIESRLRPFSLYFSKSTSIQRKFVEIIASTDPFFNDEAKMTKISLSEITKGKGFKYDIRFEPGFDKAIFFKFMLIESENEAITSKQE